MKEVLRTAPLLLIALAFWFMLTIYAGVAVWRAHAHDASAPNAAWFNDLQQPATGMSCCGPDRDCTAYDDADVQIRDGVYWVRHDQQWLEVPRTKILDRTDNPTGHFVACVHGMGEHALVLCAVRGTGA